VNVLMVTSSYPRFPGDVVAPFIESIARGVAARGHRVDVVLPHHPELRRPPGEPVSFHPYRYAPLDRWSRWGYAQSLRKDVSVRAGAFLLAPLVAFALRRTVADRIRETRYDVMHAHWVVPNAVLVAGLARSHGLPLVVSLHGSDVFVAETLLPARILARRALRQAGAVTACSEDLHRRALRLGARPERTRTVPYGAEDMGSPGIDAGAARARLGAPPGATLVLALGRLVEKKGFSYLIDAAARVPGVHVALAGAGDLESELRSQAARAGAPVRLVGALDRDSVAAALAAADIVVVPSVVDRAGNVDGLPNVLLEAMAAGRAIIASRVAGIPDVMTDGIDGVLVEEKDVPGLAAALARLAQDPARRERLGRAARATASARFGWDRAARAFEESYAAAAALDAR
jgi:glycosyltransferase involved in cell wall biosynthesis